MNKPSLILASSSPYRKQLLDKLGLHYSTHSPNIDETPLENESPESLVARLAVEKAKAVAELAEVAEHALIIGSDQVAVLNEHILTKPHTHERAVEQLQFSSGNTVSFLTSLCLYDNRRSEYQLSVDTFDVNFLPLTENQIEAYLRKEKPYDCAGSFKSEGLGISLFTRMSGKDPNSLMGLPLIALCEMLRNEGIEPLSEQLA